MLTKNNFKFYITDFFEPKVFEFLENFVNYNVWNYNDKEEKYELLLKVPGFTKKEIEVIQDEDILKIKGNSEKFGKFEKYFSIPSKVDKIKINLENGILYIYGLISEDKKSKKIEWD